MFAGALHEESIALDGNDSTEVAITLVAADGSTRDVGSGAHPDAPGRRLERISAEAATALIEEGAAKLGLEVVSVEVLRVIDDAVVTVLMTDDAKATVDRFYDDFTTPDVLVGGDPNRFEGLYVEVRDGEGVALVLAGAPRTGASWSWARPGLRDEVPGLSEPPYDPDVPPTKVIG